MKTITNLH